MTILTLHEKECCKIAEEILNKEIQNPITAEVSTDRGEATYLIFLDGRKLAKGLELKVKKELEKVIFQILMLWNLISINQFNKTKVYILKK